MGELGHPGELGRGYTIGQLEEVLAGPAWAGLTANAPTAEDVVPQALTAEDIGRLADSMLDPGIVGPVADGEQNQNDWAHAPRSIAIPGLGDLKRVGYGESRICYKLITNEGRALAVLLGAYSATEGLHVPEDLRLTPVAQNLIEKVLTYSDLRTYMCLPLSDGYNAVFLQEFGGHHRPTGGWSRLFAGASMAAARRRMQEYVADLPGGHVTVGGGELVHDRHYLFKPGQPGAALIDVPVIVRRN